MDMDFNDGWLFHRGDAPGAHLPEYDDSDWQRVDLPHDWRIYLDFDPGTPNGSAQAFLPGQEVGWYRKVFTLKPSDPAGVAWLLFNGVYHDSEVWLNGHSLGKWAYGYTGFTMDLTRFLDPKGHQVVAVRVDNASTPGCRWYSGAGIYRGVMLKTASTLHIAEWGVSITTTGVSEERATVSVGVDIIDACTESTAVTVSVNVSSPTGTVVAQGSTETFVEGGLKTTAVTELVVAEPVLWAADTPALYSLGITLSTGGRVVDNRNIPFGIRSIALDPERGLLVNGEPTKLKGVNLHHDLGCLGAEVHSDALVRRLRALRSMGCNAIRTSHNPPAPELLELCDSMGFYVVDEAFDKWRSGAYKPFFEESWQRDIRSMVLRDRNHPSVIMWSVGNEVEMQGEPGMIDILGMLADHTRSLDPTRPVTFAMEPHCNPGDLIKRVGRAGLVERTLRMAEKVDIISCNYHEQWYSAYREAKPDMLVLGSECLPYYSGEGEDFQAYRPYNPWFYVRDNDYVIGEFIWAGVDYLGEARPWPSKGWPTCPIDTCGNRKPISWFFQSVWTGEPMVRIAVYDDTLPSDMGNVIWSWPKQASHWTLPHRSGEVVRLCTYTNCDETELLVNGRSYGRKGLADFADHIVTWHVPYEAGEVTAIGYVNGKATCTHSLSTAGEPHAIRLGSDRAGIGSGSTELAFIDAVVVDDKGVPVPSADNLITFVTEGPGMVLAVDNGDLVSNERYRATQRSVFGGRCMAVVSARNAEGPGTLIVTARAEGLREASIGLRVD